jgi:hypothetical protein
MVSTVLQKVGSNINVMWDGTRSHNVSISSRALSVAVQLLRNITHQDLLISVCVKFISQDYWAATTCLVQLNTVLLSTDAM